MFEDISSALLLTGRLLLGGAFVFAGLRNILNRDLLKKIIAGRGVPQAGLLLSAGIALQIFAGICLIAGPWTRIAAAALIVFLVMATFIFHNFWDHEGAERASRINGVIGNIAIAGGFLLVMAGQ